jgi:choline-sulfatase
MTRILTLLTPVILLLSPSGETQAGKSAPNVLFLIGDDHVPYVMGAYGNEKAKTPNLDRLAESGVRFNHAYCNSPLCTPSRQSLLCGRLPHSVGVTQLATALPEGSFTLAELLKGSGYATAAIGKMHFNSNLHHGFDLRLDHPEHAAYLKEHPPKPLADGLQVLPAWKPFVDPAHIWLNGSYLPFGASKADMDGTWYAEQAVEFMKGHKDTPFCLFVGFTEPHSPYHFPIEYKGMYDPTSFEVPKPGPEDDHQIPKVFRDLSDKENQNIIAAYYTSTAFFDENVGKVLSALDELGLRDNTMVVYLGDNGYNLGQHGRFEKHCFFEEAVRVPLLVRLPKEKEQKRVVEGQVELIDLFPTVAEVCGASSPANIEGKSLLPIMRGDFLGERTFAFSEYLCTEEAMVRTSQYKLIYGTGNRQRDERYQSGYPAEHPERRLYDLLHDPGETTNIAAKPEFEEVLGEMEGAMLERFEESHYIDDSEIAGVNDMEQRLNWYLWPRD